MTGKHKNIIGLISDTAVLIYLGATKFFLHFLVNLTGGYGFFRDEFYYIACSERLAWGYVDQPPLSIFLLKFSRTIFGDSLVAIRLLPALAGAAAVFLTGWMVKKMGGGRFAQVLAALAVIVVPYYLAIHNFFSMNAFDVLFWILAAYLLVLIAQRDRPRLWIWLGVVLGLGLMNKISVLWLIAGLGVAFLVTSWRGKLATPRPWLSALIAFVIFLPHLIWQVAHGWPTLEFIRNATGQKMAGISPLDFIFQQIINMHPFTLPVWVLGLVFLFFLQKGRPFQVLGIIYVVVFLLLVINQKSRPGYLAPAYPMLLAAGALAIEPLIRKKRGKIYGTAILAILLLGGVATSPLALPVLPVETYINYSSALGMHPDTQENKSVGRLPQHYADMHGWQKMVETIAAVYHTLRPAEMARTVIFTGNYGEAGALEFLGKPYNLPPVISGHNNYWLWGPGDEPKDIFIFFGGPSEETLTELFGSVEVAATFTCDYCMPYENNTPVYLCRSPRVDIRDIWPETRHFQ